MQGKWYLDTVQRARYSIVLYSPLFLAQKEYAVNSGEENPSTTTPVLSKSSFFG